MGKGDRKNSRGNEEQCNMVQSGRDNRAWQPKGQRQRGDLQVRGDEAPSVVINVDRLPSV